MKYLVFAYDNYYPSGGWNDFRGVFDTLEEAQALKTKLNFYDYHYIVTYDGQQFVSLEDE